MEIHCLKLQNDANCTILQQGSSAVMIDAGEAVDEETILKALEERKITRLSYLILTHPDQDHIGSAKKVLEKVKVDRVIASYYPKEHPPLEEIITLCEERDIPVSYPTHTQSLKAGSMSLLIYPPFEKHYNDSNNYSLAVLVRHKDTHALFVGDALRKRSEELMRTHWPRIDLYLVAHHGRENRASAPLLRQLSPKFAVVTAERADSAITETCLELGTTIVSTAEQSWSFLSNGETLKIIE
jgi:beta-lactamase superfamily II metal-dependent hydrolase